MRLGSILHDGTRSRTGGRAVRATRRTLVVAQMACSFLLLVGAGLLWVSVRNLLNVNYRLRDRQRDHRRRQPATAALRGGRRRPVARQSLARLDPETARRRRRRSHDCRAAPRLLPKRRHHRRGLCAEAGRTSRSHGSRVGHAGLLRSGGHGRSCAAATSTIATPPRARGRLSSTNGWRGDSGAMRIPSAGASSGRRMRKNSSPIGPDTPWLTVVGVVRDAQLRGPLVTDYGTNGTFYLPVCGHRAARLRLRHPYGRRSRRPSSARSDRRSRRSIASSRSSTSGRCRSARSWHCSRGPARCSWQRCLPRWPCSCPRSACTECSPIWSHSARARLASGLPSAVRRAAIVALVLREGLGLAIGGVVLGVIGALTLGRLVASQLYGVAPTNPWVHAADDAHLDRRRHAGVHRSGAPRGERGCDEDPQRALDRPSDGLSEPSTTRASRRP